MLGKIDKKTLIYLIALFFEVVAMLIDLTTIPYMLNTELCALALRLLRYVGYFIVAIKIFMEEYRRTEICAIVLIILLLLLNSMTVGGNTVLCLFLFIIGMKNVDFHVVAKYMLIWFMSGMLMTIMLSQVGLIENWDYSLGGRLRYSLGYFYPSHATSAIFYCVCLMCYMLGDKLAIWHIIAIEALNIWQYSYTDARAGTLMMILVPIIFYMFRYIKGDISKKKWIRLFLLAFPLSFLFSLFTAIFYNGKGWMLKINSLISNRLYLSHKAMVEHGISLFGKKIEWVGNGGIGHIEVTVKGEYNYIDCSYMQIMFEYGILICLMIVIGYTVASYISIKVNNKYLLLALCFVAVYSIIEPRLIKLGFNPFVITLVALVDYSVKLKYQENT